MSFELFIGGRYLRAKRSETFVSLITLLSICGVALGVTALIVVIAVMSGAEEEFKRRILGATPHIVVLANGGGGKIFGHEKIQEDIARIKGVKGSAPFVQTQTMIRSRHGVMGAVVRGIDPELTSRVFDFSKHVEPKSALAAISGHTDTDGNTRPGIILGEELARKLAVFPGDIVNVISPSSTLSPVGHVPNMRSMSVVGVFSGGMYEYDATLAWMGLLPAQKFMRMGDAVSGIEVYVDDIYAADDISGEISEYLGHRYWSCGWMKMYSSFFAALKLEKTAMFVILILIVLVAAFNISTALIMMVTEKRKDIAILKAMGATNRSIRRIFVMNGMFIGLVGTILGISLGTILCTLLSRYQFINLDSSIYVFDKLPVNMELPDVLITSGAALTICFFAALYPAWRASRLDPVEIIRYG